MATKRYRSSTGVQLVFPIEVGGKEMFIELIGPRSEFITSDEKIQTALETNKRFKAGFVVLAETFGEAKKAEKEKTPAPGGTTEVPEITNIQEAKEYLRADPYKVAHQSLNTPDNILKKAAELNIIFPNLKV